MVAPNSLNIREGTATDIPQLCPLLEELGYPVEPGVLSKRFEEFTAKGEAALVAEHDGTIVGFLTLHVTPVLHRAGSVGRVTTLVVLKSAHGLGVGRGIMQEAERRLWAQGCVMIEVTSNKKRTDAHAFYEKLGYEHTSFRFAKTRPAGE